MSQWHTKQVAQRFEECITILRGLPGRHKLGYASYWPKIIFSTRELSQQEPSPIRLSATPDQITRMDETLSWLGWINQAERRLIWLRADRIPWRVVSLETGFPRSSAQRYYVEALIKVAKRLGLVSANDS